MLVIPGLIQDHNGIYTGCYDWGKLYHRVKGDGECNLQFAGNVISFFGSSLSLEDLSLTLTLNSTRKQKNVMSKSNTSLNIPLPCVQLQNGIVVTKKLHLSVCGPKFSSNNFILMRRAKSTYVINNS